MRLGNAEDARVASEHIGTEHRLELAQLTETISESLHGLDGGYTSTIDQLEDAARRSVARATPTWRRTSPSRPSGAGRADKIAEKERVLQRSREFLVEPHQLQQLPTTSVIVTDATAEGRRVRLADANPAILTFPKTTLGELDDVRAAGRRRRARRRQRRRRTATRSPAQPRAATATPGLAQGQAMTVNEMVNVEVMR